MSISPRLPSLIALADPTAFHTTRWSLVLAAQDKQERQDRSSRDALEALCRQYWPPLYAYVRQRGHAEHDAQDLTQAFFARFLEKDWLAAVDRKRGRFRAFLLTALKRFLANEWDRSQSQKHGGTAKIISLEAAGNFPIPDPNAKTAESAFERQWALTLLEAVMLRLREEHDAAGRSAEYELLKPCLTAARGSIDYDALAVALKMTPVSARSAVHRLRKRFREVFHCEVAGTVADPADIDSEMRAVIDALG